MANDSLALAELLFSREGLCDHCCLVSGFLTYELLTYLNPPSYYCSELNDLRELGYSLERCTNRCIKTIYVCPLPDPAIPVRLIPSPYPHLPCQSNAYVQAAPGVGSVIFCTVDFGSVFFNSFYCVPCVLRGTLVLRCTMFIFCVKAVAKRAFVACFASRFSE